MSSERFEQMSRAMGAAKTRRGLLRAFAGGLAAGALGVFAAPQPTHAATLCAQNCSTQRAWCERECPFVNSGKCRLDCFQAESTCRILCGR